MAQNIVVFRGKNSLFKRTWNKDFIEKIEIISAEEIGVEGRATFYEQTGALRDVVQSHLLQLAALTLMELPEEAQWDTIPACRLAALHQLHSATEHMSNHAMRGQYEGYRDEVGNSHSHTETFASLILESNDPNWMGVPIRIIAGKALAFKRTEIIIHFRRDTQHEANQLILRIQPDEGVELVLWSKKPGLDREMEMVKLDYQYEHHDIIPEAYERVFLDAINSDHSLFATSDEVLASWKILAPIQQAWSMHSDLIMYPVGSTPSEILIEAAN
jgi:glucose-6-phosphate 1-dehydrogenase